MEPVSVELRVRTHGTYGPDVIVLHGGPAAVGEAEPTARGLSKTFHVHEPFQRGSGAEPLTVAVHVRDLHSLVKSVTDESRPSLVGQSWGAMLALAYAAEHPAGLSAIVLVGCGTFDSESRRQMEATVESRLDEEARSRLRSLADEHPQETARMLARYELTRRAYTLDPIPTDGQLELSEPFDLRAHVETWNDMLRLQEAGIYPAAFARIEAPVLMLHGDYDPHPGRMIHATLKRYIPHLEYHELSNCGHAPWMERRARSEYFKVLSHWLLTHGDRVIES